MGGFNVSSQVFLSVNQVTSNLLEGSLSGIIGLAFTAIASSGATPFWEALVNANQLSSPEMSFWLSRSTDASQTEVLGGVFTLGGTNSSLYSGDIEFINMPGSTPSFWLLSLSAVSVGGTSVAITTGNTALAAIDTGTTLIGGPTADVAAIWAAVPGSAASQDSQGFFEFPCSTQVTISLSFGGKLWPISTKDMNLGQVSRGSSQCLGSIFDLSMGSNIPSGSGNPSWVVGDTFLKNVYSVFRASPPSIGFAQLSSLAGGSGASSATTTTQANSAVSLMPSSMMLVALVSGLLSAMFMLAL
jgi:cathepsin D